MLYEIDKDEDVSNSSEDSGRKVKARLHVATRLFLRPGVRNLPHSILAMIWLRCLEHTSGILLYNERERYYRNFKK